MRALIAGVLVSACVLGSGATAHAEDALAVRDEELSLEALEPLDLSTVPAGRPIAELIADRLTFLGDQLDVHLRALSFNHLDVRFDGKTRRARVRLAREGDQLSLRIAGDIRFERGLARVTTRVDLGISGHVLHLQLPDVEMVPRSYGGERYVELRLPLFEGHF